MQLSENETEGGRIYMPKNNALISLRLKKGLSQQEVADKADISRSSYSFYENGKRVPNLKTAMKIMEVLQPDDCKEMVNPFKYLV